MLPKSDFEVGYVASYHTGYRCESPRQLFPANYYSFWLCYTVLVVDCDLQSPFIHKFGLF